MADSLTTRILAFDFDQCVCDGEGFFELFTQLLDIYQFCHINKHTGQSLPAEFVEAVEKAYKTMALEAATASKKKELFLFRPGMENVFRTAQLMKSQGRIHYIMFYSNNSCPEFLSFLELVIRLANLNMFSVKKPVVELVFTANTASRMKVERAPAGQPNAREKTVRGILQCLEDLDLPFTAPEILFFDDLKHTGLGSSLKMVPEYKALHTGQQIHDVFFGCLEKAGLFIGGELRPEWQKLGISNSLMKNPAQVFKDWLITNKDLPAKPINVGPTYEKEIKVSEMMSSEIYTFCGAQAINKKKSRKRRGKYDQ